MTAQLSICSTALSLALALLAPTSSHAAVTTALFRTYLSVDGNDNNPCTVSAPCRLLPAALAATQNGGEVWILDSANFNTGTVSIDQSVSVLAVPGALGSLVANGGNAVMISGARTITVALHNMVFKEIDGKALYQALWVSNPTASLTLESSSYSNFYQALLIGAWSAIDISDSTFVGNQVGIAISGNSYATTAAASTITIDHCHIRQNASFGLLAANAMATVSHTAISNNGTGIAADAGSILFLDDNLITGNLDAGVDLLQGSPGALVYSSGNNVVVGNAGNGVVGGSLTLLSQQ